MTSFFRHPRTVHLSALSSACLCVALACGGGGDAPTVADAKAAAGDPAKAGEKLGEDIINKATEEAGAEHLFDPEDKTIRKKACDFLTGDMVAAQFGVPAAELKQMKIMGCMYSHEKGDQMVDAKLMMIRVHKTAEGAKQWFGNATKSKTAEELAADMKMVKEQLNKRKELDTKIKKKTANSMADMMKMATPKKGIQYDDVPGVGDEARISNDDGAMWVRLGNLTFNVHAYQGHKQPKLDIDPKNLKDIAKRSIEAQRTWINETMAQRKDAAIKLAPKIVEKIAAR